MNQEALQSSSYTIDYVAIIELHRVVNSRPKSLKPRGNTSEQADITPEIVLYPSLAYLKSITKPVIVPQLRPAIVVPLAVKADLQCNFFTPNSRPATEAAS